MEDAEKGLVLAAERYDKPEPVNIEAGFEISIRGVFGLIVQLTGFEGEVEWDTSEPDGQPRCTLDSSRAKQEFGFDALAPFRECLERTIRWYEEPGWV